jgi:hypothetical protein
MTGYYSGVPPPTSQARFDDAAVLTHSNGRNRVFRASRTGEVGYGMDALTRRGLACERLGFDWPEAGRICSLSPQPQHKRSGLLPLLPPVTKLRRAVRVVMPVLASKDPML